MGSFEFKFQWIFAFFCVILSLSFNINETFKDLFTVPLAKKGGNVNIIFD